MDLYISSLLLGVLGLGAMALSGLGHPGHGTPGHNSGHGHPSPGAGAHAAHGTHHAPGHQHGSGNRDAFLWSMMSPRVLFSLALGFGAVGELVDPFTGGVLRMAVAVLGALLFERFLVTPLWNFTMRFASQPALTLESAVADEATAVTAFDANGQGIVSIEVDGQVVEV